MDSLLTFVSENAHSAHWVIFLLIMLAGLNVPLSEDILVLAGGAIASTYIPENTLKIFVWIYAGAWMSAWEAYWIGRLLGPKLYEIRWFSHVLTFKRIERLHHFYEKYGILTFLVGRFIPGGVRNALFMTSGLGKMPFHKFILRDMPCCLLQVSILFYLGYLLGENYTSVITAIRTYNLVFLVIFVGVLVGLFYWSRGNQKQEL
jgi:membrane-associated protein